MRTAVLTSLAVTGLALVSTAAPAPAGWHRWLPSVFGNLAITKERAERGDVRAQVQLAGDLAVHHHAADAVVWYRKAAEHGNVEAEFRLGEILINGQSMCQDPNQRVAPRPAEGVQWTYQAATNFHAGACCTMSYVLEHGIGLGTNLIESYAWLELYARSNSSDAERQMSRLALQMHLDDIRESHALAKRFLKRQWPHYFTHKLPDADLVLKLNGITIGPVSLAIINDQILELGDSVAIPNKHGTALVTCVKISEDSVLVAVEGEDEPRVLRLR